MKKGIAFLYIIPYNQTCCWGKETEPDPTYKIVYRSKSSNKERKGTKTK